MKKLFALMAGISLLTACNRDTGTPGDTGDTGYGRSSSPSASDRMSRDQSNPTVNTNGSMTAPAPGANAPSATPSAPMDHSPTPAPQNPGSSGSTETPRTTAPDNSGGQNNTAAPRSSTPPQDQGSSDSGNR
ncbi:MAG: hypothetical protein U1G07_25220 [Verrucomicrobiota bacterium]